MPHAILLFQPNNRMESRSFSDFETVNECLEGVCKIFEEYLKVATADSPKVTYEASQLFDFIDRVYDMSCLVHQNATNTYVPHNKEWIKERLYVLLRQCASK